MPWWPPRLDFLSDSLQHNTKFSKKNATTGQSADDVLFQWELDQAAEVMAGIIICFGKSFLPRSRSLFSPKSFRNHFYIAIFPSDFRPNDQLHYPP